MMKMLNWKRMWNDAILARVTNLLADTEEPYLLEACRVCLTELLLQE